MQKPSIPKGTRDFSPSEISRRNFIFDTMKSKFQKFKKNSKLFKTKTSAVLTPKGGLSRMTK